MDIKINKETPEPLLKFDEGMPFFERFSIIDLKDLIKEIGTNAHIRINSYCFIFMEGGYWDLEINGYEKRAKAGVLVSGIPGEIWKFKDYSNPKGKLIMFEASFILAGLKGGYSLEPISNLNSENHYPFIPLSEKRAARLQVLIEDMEECKEDTPINFDLLRAQLWQFIFLAEKEYVANGNQGRISNSPNYIPTFINLVNKHYRKNKDTMFYAKSLNISITHLRKLVRKHLGTSVREYVLNRSISEAKLLLRLTDVNVNEIAYNLGFEDPNYFTRLFKKYEGMTPGEFRKKGTL